jgi:hypothetical protein
LFVTSDTLSEDEVFVRSIVAAPLIFNVAVDSCVVLVSLPLESVPSAATLR